MAESAHFFDATQENFENEVIKASLQTPVLVDFWAEWCAPCLQLKPVLEKLADEYAGAFRLAKVDTEAEMQLASIFGIRSLPTVVLLKDGQMIDGFMGALPEAGVREFLAKHAIHPGAPEPAETIDLAETPAETVNRLQQEIAAQPDKTELKLDLALALMQSGNAAAAEAELDALPAKFATDAKAVRLRGQLDFARALEGAPSKAELLQRVEHDAADHAARDLLGIRLLLDGEAAAGLDQFLHVLKTQRDWQDGQAKKRLIAAFHVLDDADLVGTYRRKMAAVLF
ncbi:thioredoxin [Tahibacter aquaticus]|uniref:Thioredoxin n=1 Tax=Tahibacter aquaticus TaxID=520092 RepID=A0A4R6YRY4_9GAMM|nr:thioredoxin [Tahibacter aquaticus]TDR40849.1 thioredoxin [Tahibacter aquaticus]